MPVSPTYPGVYIEEVPSGVRTIVGVATSITAFIGRALRGPVNDPVRIQSFADFERKFGGLWVKSTMSYAVQHFYLHGGKDALIVRVTHQEPLSPPEEAATAAVDLLVASPPDTLTLEASSPGTWGDALWVNVDYDTKDPADATLFNLTVQERASTNADETQVVAAEVFRNLTVDPESATFITKMLEEESGLVRVRDDVPSDRPDETPDVGSPPETDYEQFAGGGDGGDLEDNDILGEQLERSGLHALDKADLFNLLCIPPLTRDTDVDLTTTVATAATYCKGRRAMLVVDPPSGWNDVDDAESGVNDVRNAVGTDNATNILVYFPRLKMADALKENRTEEFVPCGALAGIIARTDANRGVWKASAGLEASFSGVRELSYKATDDENGRLNPLGLNVLRTFPVFGHVVWGARTLAGADRLGSEWKFAPVRRLALFVEESLYRGTQWAVFEPNDEPLWAQLRLNVGSFMQNLFRQGAFQGSAARDAYFVKCDSETTTQNDINLGIVNILVGFAPLKPAEFVIIKIQQLAGQVET